MQFNTAGSLNFLIDATGNVTATNDVRMSDSDGSHYVGFEAPAIVTTSLVWTLPAADGTNGQALTTDGSGTLSWADAGGTDADTLDGLDSTQFLRSDAADAKTTGDLTFNDNVKIVLGNSKTSELYCNGTDLYLDLDGGSDFFIRDNTTTRYTFSNGGNFTATGNVTAYSDINLKENIQVIPDALNKVSQLRGVTYNRKDMEGDRQSGVIAQEVEQVLPEVVRTDKDGIKSVAYGNLVGLLIESIKELKIEIEKLKNGVS